MKNDRMIKQFALYGFLKNFRFFEPFFLLFLRGKGLSFFEIGLLYSFREVCINLFEVPSGAVADMLGRKKVLVFSLLSYIASFFIFGITTNLYFVFAAMFFFAIGESFRSGTHKAMIFDYLRFNDRIAEKKQVYGYTRSWSQTGSAFSVLVAALIVYLSKDYQMVFYCSIIPYILGVINIMCYPASLNGEVSAQFSMKVALEHLASSIKAVFSVAALRQLLLFSTFLHGGYKAIKDYLQPIIEMQVLIIPLGLGLVLEQRTAILSGLCYFVLYLLTAYASRMSHRFSSFFSSDLMAIKVLTLLVGLSCLGAAFFQYHAIYSVTIVAFILISLIQNIFRPLSISIFDDWVDPKYQATVLSIESQANTIGVAVLGPVVGLCADRFGVYSIFLVVGFFSLVLFFSARKTT